MISLSSLENYIVKDLDRDDSRSTNDSNTKLLLYVVVASRALFGIRVNTASPNRLIAWFHSRLELESSNQSAWAVNVYTYT